VSLRESWGAAAHSLAADGGSVTRVAVDIFTPRLGYTQMRGLVVLTALSMCVAAAGASPSGLAPSPTVDRFDGARAYTWVRRQVAIGPRSAGSPASRRLAGQLRAALPRGRFQPVPGGLRNVIGVVPGRQPQRMVIVGAHYDTKDLPGFVGANDGGSGVAVVLELARIVRAHPVRPTIVFALFDGEESPSDGPQDDFYEHGLRGSKAAAAAFEAESMILLDMVGDRDLRIPRERNSNRQYWARLRAAAQRVGVGSVFPPATVPAVIDDHVPFVRKGIIAVDLIDFEFACWHLRCDNLSKVSARSLDAVGEATFELLRTL
jgi:glutaminyl-peptide cyclotransferase